jgi:hypothetical protein
MVSVITVSCGYDAITLLSVFNVGLCVKYGISRAIAFVKSAEREKRAERNKNCISFLLC